MSRTGTTSYELTDSEAQALRDYITMRDMLHGETTTEERAATEAAELAAKKAKKVARKKARREVLETFVDGGRWGLLWGWRAVVTVGAASALGWLG